MTSTITIDLNSLWRKLDRLPEKVWFETENLVSFKIASFNFCVWDREHNNSV